MPSTFSRHSRPPSPPSPTLSHPATTPVRTYVRRPSSSSYTPTVTSNGQQAPKVNITRLAIEGRARQNHDGAYVKMYLKLSLPLDSVAPGSTVPLFPEENIKVLHSQVHPLDNNSVPYNFSSSSSPLLQDAARALHLPPRSAESFYAAFGIQTGSPSTSSPSSRTLNPEASRESVTPVDPHYAGHILVSNYAISYVLPKAFLTRNRSTADVDAGSQSSLRSRRGSIGERNAMQFMAAIDMWIPYVSKPPRSPYLLSIPTPRCLHNHIKLRIFPPSPAASSLASLSSVEDDGSTWDVASDPHVSRVASNRLTRTHSYSNFADDESSDSSQTTSSDGCSIQGTFPSAERIRLRWAKPMKVVDVPDGGDGRRRVGVREVKGDMTCVVQAKYRDPVKNVEAVMMHVEYKGTCKGIWFPGVATLLGLDVGLEAKNSDVSWVPGASPTWEVEGSPGYSGFDVGHGPLLSPDSRASSFDSTISQMTPSPVEFPGYDTQMNAHHDLSTPSLLRAPLPNSNAGECSFDSSTGENASAEWTSPTSSALQASTDASKPPGTPITLHLNMNELLPPVQNVFTFTASGTILVMPRMTLARASRQGLNAQSDFDDGAESEPVVLPRFTVLAADAETTTIVVRNEVESMCVVEVYNATGDLKDAQIRKTVLQKGGFTKCGDDGGRIVLKNIRQQSPIPSEPHPRTPNGHLFSRLSAAGSPLRTASPLRFKKDGPLLIPAVENRVTLFGAGTKESPLCYAVRCTLNVPPNAESEWLEFGLGLPRARRTKTKASISIINASVEGVPVRFEITSAGMLDRTVASGVSPAFDQVGSVEWAAWAKVHVGALGGTHIVVDYLVKRERETGAMKTGQREAVQNVLLPTFALPVGRLDGRITTHPDLCIADLKTNFSVEHCGEAKCKFSHFSAAEYFVPQISMTVKSKAKSRTRFLMSGLLQAIPWLMLFAALLHVRHATAPIREPSHIPAVSPAQTISLTTTTEYITIEPITITSTVYKTLTSTSTSRPMATSSTESPTPTRSASNPKLTETLKYVPPNDSTALSPTSPAVWTIPWPVEDVHVAVVVDKLCDAAEIMWQMLRRAYHYPLDPP